MCLVAVDWGWLDGKIGPVPVMERLGRLHGSGSGVFCSWTEEKLEERRVYVKIVGFQREHLVAAKKLALQSYNEERKHVTILPDVAELPGLEELAENGLGVAALAEGELVGFLCCHQPREKAFRSLARGVFVPVHGHGATGENRELIYQRLYQAAAEKWVKAGITYHGVALYAHDTTVVHAMFASGFGLRCVDAIRPMEPMAEASAAGILCTELAKSDQANIRELRRRLMEHLGRSPCFMYWQPDEIESHLAQLEADEVRLFAAKHGDTYVAFAEVSPCGENFATEAEDMLNITGAYCLPEYRGRDIYPSLLNYMMVALRNEGYLRLGVDFESFNPAAYRFWGKYFTNYTYSVVRRIDECALADAGDTNQQF
jgi:GNAT superfamily N-acetyltransferase